ncbi:MAG: hypoxanthine phosphoribosyltransferase [Coriobacteriia bacterium]|nr:hypoxanthine phosphoribosyltransferase [Coriobacteriia bacterium]
MASVLIDEDRLARRIAELGERITADYATRPPLLVTVLRGGLFFLADLCRHIDLPVRIDFMAVSAYEHGAPGQVRITKDLDEPIEGVPVLVVEDIIDTGLTLNYVLRVLRQRNPSSLEVCALLDKDVRRIVDLPVAYRGFRVPDRFLVGYGLDLDGRLRALPYVGTLREEALRG